MVWSPVGDQSMTPQTRIYFTVAVGLLVMVGLLWWGDVRDRGRNQQPVVDAVKVGALVPLTGDFAVLGESIRNGMDLAKNELLAAGVAQKVEIVYEDVCLPKDAVSAVQKMIQVDGVRAIGASFCLIGLEAVIPMTEESKVIVFNTAANTDGVLNKEYVFSTNFSIKDDAQKIAAYAFNDLGARTAAVVYFATPFGDDYNRYLSQYFEQLGGRIVASERGDINKVDFRTEVAKIKAQEPDVVFVVYLANSLGGFLKQARELGLGVPIVGHYEAEDPTVLAAAGSAAEGFIISSSEPAQQTAEVRGFREGYRERYGADPDILAGNAYDALKLLVTAYQQCHGAAECMKAYLAETGVYEGASGTITFNPDGSASKPTVFKVVREGAFVVRQ